MLAFEQIIIKIRNNGLRTLEKLFSQSIYSDDESFLYVIGSEVLSVDNIPNGFISRKIPAATYAVFLAQGEIPDSIQRMTRYIYNDWLPNSKFQLANSPDFELYDERRLSGTIKDVEIYIPVKEKE